MSTLRDGTPSLGRQWRLAGVLAHGYFGIDVERVWTTVERDLPGLKRQVGSIVANWDEPAER